jgi:hypothetical protein
MSEWIDLGHDHAIKFARWAPDRKLNPQYADVPDCERYSAIVRHRRGPNPIPGEDSEWCEGGITFASQTQQRIQPGRPTWTVDSWEPMTFSPSLLCRCGDHGFIRAGKWVPA